MRNVAMLFGGSSGSSGPASSSTFAWASNAASIDVSKFQNFAASNTLTGNSTLTLTGGADGLGGQIYVKQDATGGRTLTFTVAGRTTLREQGAVDSNPNILASSITGYTYLFVTIAGTAYVVIQRFQVA